MKTTVSDGFVYIEKSTVGGLARPLTLRQQKTMGRTSTKRTQKIVSQAILSADMELLTQYAFQKSA